MKVRILPFLFAALSSLSMDALGSDPDFQRSLSQLNAHQQKLDRILGNVGVGFRTAPGVESGAEQKVMPLYQVHAELNPVLIQPGKIYFGRLVHRLVVGADGSPVLVELDSAQGFASGLRVMGMARQAGSQGRISVEVNRLLLRSGHAVSITAVVLDSAGGFGIPAQVFSGKAIAVAGAMASSFISGALTSQQTQSMSAFGLSQTQPTARNAILQGAAQTASDQSKRLIEEGTSEKPVMTAEALTAVTVLIQEEVRL